MADKMKCVKYNSLGECVEFVPVGDKIVLKFKDGVEKCNPELHEEWKRLTKPGENKLKILPAD